MLAALAQAPAAGAGTVVELLGGGAWGAATPLTIRQGGEEDLHFSARYRTHALESPPYYAVRVRVGHRHRWEGQLIHHKLFLTEAPDDVQSFTVTHGFNILTVNRAFEAGRFRLRLGAGLVVAHPESTVRGATLPSDGGLLDRGYRATGPVLLAGAGKELSLTRRLFVTAELQLVAARFRVPVAGGSASGSNLALHALLGLGFRL